MTRLGRSRRCTQDGLPKRLKTAEELCVPFRPSFKDFATRGVLLRIRGGADCPGMLLVSASLQEQTNQPRLWPGLQYDPWRTRVSPLVLQ